MQELHILLTTGTRGSILNYNSTKKNLHNPAGLRGKKKNSIKRTLSSQLNSAVQGQSRCSEVQHS